MISFLILKYVIKMKNTKSIVKTVATLAVIGSVFTGCSQQEAQLANTLASTAVNAAGSPHASVNNLKTLASPAGAGMVQSQVVGAQMLMNPGVLGAGAVGTALSEYNKAQNRKAFGDISNMYMNSDRVNSQMERMMLQAYNKQNGTHYKTMAQAQEATKIQAYNKKYGTKYTTFSQVRVDYDKRKGTHFKTDNEFRAWLANSR